MKKEIIKLTLSAVLGFLAAWGLIKQLTTDHQPLTSLNAVVYPQPKPIEDVHLIRDNQQNFSLKKLQGRWVVVFLGYTHCPDVCPTSLGYLAQEYRNLLEFKDNVAVVFISVDPERDQFPKLQEYVSYFHKDFIALTASYEDLKRLSHSLGADFERGVYAKNSQDYTVNHPSDIFLLNPEGKLFGVYRAPHKPGLLSGDLKTLILKGQS